jgi:hypothetical protein
MHKKFWSEDLKGRDNFGDQDMYGSVILNWVLKEIVCEFVDWINLADDGSRGGLLRTRK